MDKNLKIILYGEDGMSGLLGTLRMEGILDGEEKDKAIEAIKKLVEETKDNPDFPSDDIASLCDMFIDLTVHARDDVAVGNLLEEMNFLIQGWYQE